MPILIMSAADPDPCTEVDKGEVTDQPSLNECAASQFEKVDEELNQLWKQLEKKYASNKTEWKSLVAAQREWVRKKEKKCDKESGGMEGGQAASMIYSGCSEEETKSRIKYLATKK